MKFSRIIALSLLSISLQFLAQNNAITTAQNQQQGTKKPIIVYVDMVADLFHYGHVEFLKKAKAYGDYLIVGLMSDEDTASYKRIPILTLEERVKSVQGCKYVDEVIPAAPLRITAKFIKENNIDLVIRGDDFDSKTIEYYYGEAIKLGKFKTVPYTPTISTTNIITRIGQYLEQKKLKKS